MATLKYEIWEREGVIERNTIKINHWENFILHRCKEWSKYVNVFGGKSISQII